ncbi:MAG: serine/threonine-protein kinase [Gemmatimonadaceae bacterium]
MNDLFHEQLVEALGSNYTLDRELTGGGMSRVFVATEHTLNRAVVVKVLRPELAADVNRDRFRREIMLAAQLQHPLIVPVLSAGQHRELLWYTMPFIVGESLREEIRRGPPASARNAIRVLHDVLDALAYAHERGVVHRDIKPGNILRHGNHSLVTDFGVAKALSAALPSSGATSAGIAIGTPAYMAPEQLAADPNANHRMDIYAVGLLVYELLTGTQAFAESSPQATMAAQLTRMPRDLALARPDVPPQLSALVMRMLAKSPDDRPQTATAALDELDAIVTPTGTTLPAGRTRRTSTRWLAATAGAALVGAAALLAWGTRQPKPSPDRPAVKPPPIVATSQAAPAPGRGAADSVKSRPRPAAGTRAGDTTEARVRAAPTKAPDTPKATTPITPARRRRTAAPTPLLNRRVALLPIRSSTNRANIGSVVQAIEDSLQKSLKAAGYTLAHDRELLRLVTEQNRARGALRRAADSAGIGAVVSMEVVARGDELSAIAQVLDVWRAQTSSAREATDLDKSMDLLNVVRTVSRSVDRVSWRSRTDPKRVMVFAVENRTGIDSLSVVARQVEDSLRAAAARFGAVVLTLDSASSSTRDVTERRQLGIRRGAGAIVAASVARARRDSAVVVVSVRDMSEDRTLPSITVRLPLDGVRTAAASVAAMLVDALRQVNWGPRAVPDS